jgi:fucose permease
MWGVNAAAPLNAANVGYGIGALLVNLLVRPFVTKNIPSINATDNQEINTMKNNSNIFIPYTIVAGLCVLIAIGFVFFYIRELKSQRQKLEVRQVR